MQAFVITGEMLTGLSPSYLGGPPNGLFGQSDQELVRGAAKLSQQSVTLNLWAGAPNCPLRIKPNVQRLPPAFHHHGDPETLVTKSTMISSRLARPAFAAARRTAPISIRGYASPAAPDTKPPVPLFGIDGTYASALYTAAAKQNALDPVGRALSSLGSVFKNDPKLGVILHAPTLNQGDKSQIIAELEKHTGGQDKNNTLKNFLQTLAENNRLGILEGVCEKFGILMSAHRGEVELSITSAAKLDDRMVKRIETAIQKSEYSQGKKLKVVTKVNSEILGGLVVEVGERTIDFSVANKISRMNKMLTDTV